MADASGRNDLVVKTPDGDRKSLRFGLSLKPRSRFPSRYAAVERRPQPSGELSIPIKETLRRKGFFRLSSPRGQSYRAITGYLTQNRSAGGDGSLFTVTAKRVDAEVISPDKTPDLPNFAKPLRARAVRWNFGGHRRSAIYWTNVSRGGVGYISTSKKVISSPRAQVFARQNSIRHWSAGGELQNCCTARGYATTGCEALVDFQTGKELRELSAWIARRCAK